MSGAEYEGLLTHWEAEPIHVWEALWEVPAFEAWESIESTNDRARALASSGALPFSVVIAEEQTRGRGRGGRRWDSPAGLGLWMSVVLRPAANEALRLAPLLVGLAACRAVELVARGLSATLKWPNDVLMSGRKVAGVLCEAVGDDALVAGVGFNVKQRLADFPVDLRDRAVSLEMAAGRAIARGQLAGALLREMRHLLARPPVRLQGAVASEIARRDALAGAVVQVEGGVCGLARGIDASGRLLVETVPGSVIQVSAGSVSLVADGRADARTWGASPSRASGGEP